MQVLIYNLNHTALTLNKEKNVYNVFNEVWMDLHSLSIITQIGQPYCGCRGTVLADVS